MTKFLTRAAWFFTLLLTAAAQEIKGEALEALLKKLQAQRRETPGLTAEFTEERTTRLLNKPIISQGSITFLPPSHFRRELRGNAPSTTVCNGRELWIHYPRFAQAERYTLGERHIFDDSLAALTAGLAFDDVEKHFHITALAEPGAIQFTLTPRSASLRKLLIRLTVWVDEKGTLQKTDATLPKGDRVVTTYRDVRAVKTTATQFDFSPPPGTQITTPLER